MELQDEVKAQGMLWSNHMDVDFREDITGRFLGKFIYNYGKL